jgi:hypothetical protein
MSGDELVDFAEGLARIASTGGGPKALAAHVAASLDAAVLVEDADQPSPSSSRATPAAARTGGARFWDRLLSRAYDDPIEARDDATSRGHHARAPGYVAVAIEAEGLDEAVAAAEERRPAANLPRNAAFAQRRGRRPRARRRLRLPRARRRSKSTRRTRAPRRR